MRLICWLKSVIVVPGHLAVLGSLFDFAGPGVSRKFRLFLFRVLGGALAADFYLYRSETQRLRALLIGLVSGALCQVKIHDLENLPKGGFLLLLNHLRCSWPAQDRFGFSCASLPASIGG